MFIKAKERVETGPFLGMCCPINFTAKPGTTLWDLSVLWFWMSAHSQAEHPAAVPAGGR